MNVLIDAILEKNLGDDIFLNILANRYNANFIGQSRIKYDKNELPVNVKLYNGLTVTITNKLGRLFFDNGRYFSELLKRKCEMLVSIGGSIFVEWGEIDTIKRHFAIYNNKLPYYILGANFGPYITEEFYQYIKQEVINHSEDTCFRDEYSHNLFKELNNVRHGSDIVFTLDTKNLTMSNEKRVIISIINCKERENIDTEQYEQKIIELIVFFHKKQYKVTLMSFCQAEGDEEAIQSILAKQNKDGNGQKIDIYFYRGNIREALNIISNSQIIAGTRFHANILGLIMNKTIIPLVYSDKTLQVLKDMDFQGKVFDIRKHEKFDINSITDDDLNYKLDVSWQIKDAERQFEKLDLVLERKGSFNDNKN